jgi:hypothetical protein
MSWQLLWTLYRTGSRIHRIERWCRSWAAGVAHLGIQIFITSQIFIYKVRNEEKKVEMESNWIHSITLLVDRAYLYF